METPQQQQQQLPMPSMPEIGHPEQYYARQAALADRLGDVHSREAAKVGQYVTLGLDPHRKWSEKLKYFQHALRRHCNPPALPSDPVWLFYQNLSELVKRHCGEEALRLACVEDDRYANWMQRGGTREEIRQHAIDFFHELMGWGDLCPEHFKPEDWDQLRLIRAQWV